MTARKRKRETLPAKQPRDDAPEHPLDPADAAFLDPGAGGRAQPGPPGYGDYEGERPAAHPTPEGKRRRRA